MAESNNLVSMQFNNAELSIRRDNPIRTTFTSVFPEVISWPLLLASAVLRTITAVSDPTETQSRRRTNQSRLGIIP